MRRPALVCFVVLLSLAPARAEEKPIPIEVAPLHGVEVTDAHLAWIRTWLRDHLHPVEIARLEVDVDNRTHPTLLVYAEARLPARVVDTYSVQRSIRLAHESWDTFGDRYGFEHAETIGTWRVLDTYRIERVFPLGDVSKTLRLADDLSYAEVHALLKAIQAKAWRVMPKAEGSVLPDLDRISSIYEDDGQYNVMMTNPDDGLQGTWCKGTMENGEFVIHEAGMWIS